MAELDPSDLTAPARTRSAGNADAGLGSDEADTGNRAGGESDPDPGSETNSASTTAAGGDTAAARDAAASGDAAASTDAAASSDSAGGSETAAANGTPAAAGDDQAESAADDATDHTLAGYIAQHGRPPAFEGSDAQPYTVDVDVDETNDPERPYAAFLVFLRWAGNASGVMEHLESGDVAYDQSDTGARHAALALTLYQIKAELDAAIERRRTERGW